MSLRDEIAKLYSVEATLDEKTADEVADSILALPSGLVAVGECNCEDGYVGTEMIGHKKCQKCNGTGHIERDMSLQEVVEWAKLQAMNDVDGCILSSGERVEVKK